MIAALADARWTARRWAVLACAVTAARAHLDERGLARLGRDGLVVLNLHSISPRTGSLSPPIAPEALDALVGWLVRHCRVGTLAEAADGAAAPAGDDRPRAVLTFDDGYRDFVEYAMPVLDSHGVRANVNVVPACVDSGLPPWNVVLLHRLEALPRERMRAISLPGLASGPDGRGHAARMRYAIALSRVLKCRPRAERGPLVAELDAQLGEADGVRIPPMLSRGDLAEVGRHHEIGLHSFDHDTMALESDAFFRGDLERCLAWAAAHLDARPAVYAFPNGSARPEQVRIARQAGVDDVLLGGERPSRAGAHTHPRITQYGDRESTLRLRIARALYAPGARPAAGGARVAPVATPGFGETPA
jgi:peptidoglycan/xylan/chitin deacetylase (PgdA/CDA1 family)